MKGQEGRSKQLSALGSFKEWPENQSNGRDYSNGKGASPRPGELA